MNDNLLTEFLVILVKLGVILERNLVMRVWVWWNASF